MATSNQGSVAQLCFPALDIALRGNSMTYIFALDITLVLSGDTQIKNAIVFK